MKKNRDRLAQRIAGLKETPQTGSPAAVVRKRKQPRDSERQATFRFGHVYIDERTELPCIIKDLSSKGARIVLEGDFGLPPVVVFKAETMAVKKRAAVIWQEEREAGLAFQID